MITRLSERLYTWAKGWRVLASLAAFMALLLMPPLADPDLLSQSLDGMVFYTPERAFSAIASYGEAGRTQVLWVHVADFLIILVYTSLFCLSISWLLQRGFEPTSKMRRLNVLPLLGGLFDVLENLCVMTLILVYPAQPVALAWLSTAFTTSKYSSTVLILVPLLIGLVKAGMNGFKVQRG
jgi:hypothetical protein